MLVREENGWWLWEDVPLADPDCIESETWTDYFWTQYNDATELVSELFEYVTSDEGLMTIRFSMS